MVDKSTALNDLRKERDEAKALAGDRPAHTSDLDYKRGRADGLDEAVKRMEEE